mgnify:CR=1 FL=1
MKGIQDYVTTFPEELHSVKAILVYKQNNDSTLFENTASWLFPYSFFQEMIANVVNLWGQLFSRSTEQI